MSMKLFIESSLSGHRHGRFITGQLGAEVAEALPKEGLLLMHGKTFQQLEQSKQTEYTNWAANPGCALLLLPPYEIGKVFRELDWKIKFADDIADSDDGVVPNTLAGEVSLLIDGQDGDFDRSLGQQWRDFTINTRLFKKHSGTGVIGATCLPLWSISLLELASETKEWLSGLYAYVGQSGEVADKTESEKLMPSDYSVLVCFYAWGIKSLVELQNRLSSKNSVITLQAEVISICVNRLTEFGYVNAEGISEQGKTELMNSPYWPYAESLEQEELR